MTLEVLLAVVLHSGVGVDYEQVKWMVEFFDIAGDWHWRLALYVLGCFWEMVVPNTVHCYSHYCGCVVNLGCAWGTWMLFCVVSS